MSEPTNGLNTNNLTTTEMSWKLGPREFVFKNIRYLPWIILSVAIASVLAYLKIRYTPKIYHIQSSLLIKNDNSNKGQMSDRFDELFMGQGATNLSNEMQILSSRPVLQRVARNLDMQIRHYNHGNVRTSLLYPSSPIKMQILAMKDPEASWGISINALNDKEFTIGKSQRKYIFGEPIDMNGNHFIL